MAAPGGLTTRVAVGALLAVIAATAVWLGGLVFTTLVAAAALLMSAEWCVMHGIVRGVRIASLAILATVAEVTVFASAGAALTVLCCATGLLGLLMARFDRSHTLWGMTGLLYSGLPLVALLWLRRLPEIGLESTTAVLVIVSATDIAAFFVGRAIGGPKFAPAISPNKTWAGVAGGIGAAAAVGGFVGWQATDLLAGNGGGRVVVATLGAALLAIVAIGGDLFESWLKRRAGVKDSGNLLPGHGGVMDRLDGLVPTAVVAALLVGGLMSGPR